MRIPAITGIIKRRLLVNFRADPAVTQKILPSRFRPKLQAGNAMVGVCLIRLEGIRPLGFPAMLGINSENAAHRIAVQWMDDEGVNREGVFIPRRDTGSRLVTFAGGRIFPGEHHHARFEVDDDGQRVDLHMKSDDGEADVRVLGQESGGWPSTSCFPTLADASAFFEGGCLGYSVTRNARRLDGLWLKTKSWCVKAFDTKEASSSFLRNPGIFPSGSLKYDHTLIMRDLPHEWHQADDLTAA